jgi:hypothetical protein
VTESVVGLVACETLERVFDWQAPPGLKVRKLWVTRRPLA